MDHAAAHERIADLALETDGLERLATSTAEPDPELRDHLRTCVSCRAELDAARALRDRLRAAFVTMPGAAMVEPIAPPDALRSAILDAAHREQHAGLAVAAGASDATSGATAARDDEAARRRGWRSRIGPTHRVASGAPRWAAAPRWATGSRWVAALAAALVIALIGGVAGMQYERASTSSGDDSIAAVVATVDRVLAADQHRIVQLRTPDGTVAGSVAWSQRDFAVLASSLSIPPAGQVYRCWLEWAGQSASIGAMDFAGSTAYWTGSVGEWASVAFDPATKFVVTLEPAGNVRPTQPTTPAVLQADLGT